MNNKIAIGNVISLKKKHPCGGYSWTIYRIGADVSEGIDVGRDTDWSVAVVLSAESMDEVAMLSV